MKHFGRALLLSAAAIAGVALVAGAPAAADTLVTKSGAQVATKGPWKVKGNQVVFTRPDGSLASLRVADVDLDRSAAATAKAAAPPAPPAPAKPAKPVVLRLTDNDVSHTTDTDSVAAADKPAATPEAAAAAGATALVVQGWDKHPGENGDGILITGSLLNPTKNTATEITLDVGLYGADGKLIQIVRASLASETLPPGQKTTFRCPFPGVESMSAAKFDARSKTQSAGQEAPETTTPPGSALPPSN